MINVVHFINIIKNYFLLLLIKLTNFLRILTLIISYFRHRAVNIFVRSFYELWLQDENIGQEVMIEDLTVSFNQNFSFY